MSLTWDINSYRKGSITLAQPVMWSGIGANPACGCLLHLWAPRTNQMQHYHLSSLSHSFSNLSLPPFLHKHRHQSILSFTTINTSIHHFQWWKQEVLLENALSLILASEIGRKWRHSCITKQHKHSNFCQSTGLSCQTNPTNLDLNLTLQRRQSNPTPLILNLTPPKGRIVLFQWIFFNYEITVV